MTCQTCQHYLPATPEQGLCRRFPPTLFLREDNSTVSLFPPMKPEGLCGEHKEQQNA